MRWLAILAMLVPQLAAAQTASVIGSNGMRYTMTENEHGFVLTSLYPLAREVAAPGIFEEGLEVMYFGKTCDASSPVMGDGTWDFGNAGFGARLERARDGYPPIRFSVGFPRMEPIIAPPACRN